MTATSRGKFVTEGVRRREWAGWLLIGYLVPLSALVFSARLSPMGLHQLAETAIGHSERLGLFPGLGFGHLEAAANVLVFLPIGLLLSCLLARSSGERRTERSGLPAWAVWLLATSMSVFIELVQFFLLTERSATLQDMACNAAGALFGVLAYRIITVRRHRAHQRRDHEQ